jgi:hypothetical protein
MIRVKVSVTTDYAHVRTYTSHRHKEGAKKSTAAIRGKKMMVIDP